MPEAAVNEHAGPQILEHKIGTPGKAPVVKPKAKAKPMRRRSHGTFGRRVAAFDARHVVAALSAGEHVHHPFSNVIVV
jgi:hypothetical protein